MRARRMSVVGDGLDGLTPSSTRWSTRKFERPRATNHSPTVRTPLPYGTSALTVGVRVRRRDDERHARLEDAVDLTQEATEIVDVVERLRGHDDVARSRRDVAEVGEVGLQALHGDLGEFRTARTSARRVGSGSTAIDFAPLAGERDGVAPRRHAEFDGSGAVAARRRTGGVRRHRVSLTRR